MAHTPTPPPPVARTKYARNHTEAALALYARYEPARAACRPHECIHGPLCWVTYGPPAFLHTNYGGCRGCHGMPLWHG